jgi:G3E family GTPase
MTDQSNQRSKIKVFILTGFLGAGKTTLLNSLLRQFEGQRNVVIENEFGKANIDAQLVESKVEAVRELTNGCICCSLDAELYEVLAELTLEDQPIDNLFVETTGIADAGGVAAMFQRRDVAAHYDLRKVVCVADAQLVEDYLNETEETQKQIVSADVLVINKINTVSPNYLSSLTSLLQGINPFATIVTTPTGDLPAKYLLLPSEPRPLVEARVLARQHQHKINNVLYESDAYLSINALQHALSTTLFLYYHQVFRIKGFVKSMDKKIYEVQSVGRSLFIKPVEKPDFVQNQLVFIGRQLQTDTIQRIMRQAVFVTQAG